MTYRDPARPGCTGRDECSCRTCLREVAQYSRRPKYTAPANPLSTATLDERTEPLVKVLETYGEVAVERGNTRLAGLWWDTAVVWVRTKTTGRRFSVTIVQGRPRAVVELHGEDAKQWPTCTVEQGTTKEIMRGLVALGRRAR